MCVLTNHIEFRKILRYTRIYIIIDKRKKHKKNINFNEQSVIILVFIYFTDNKSNVQYLIVNFYFKLYNMIQ